MPAPPAPAAQPTTGEVRTRRRRLPLTALALVALLVAFAAGVLHLFRLRFDVGDVYPPYSTLRADPLGANPTEWPYLFTSSDLHRLEDVAARGGRVVLTFQPITHLPTYAALDHTREEYRENRESEKREEARDKAREKDKERVRRRAPQPPREPERPDLLSEWLIDFRRESPEKSGQPEEPSAGSSKDAAQADEARPAPGQAGAGESPVPWHTVLDFRVDPPWTQYGGWRSLYERGGKPVVVARPWGKQGGEIVLVSDSYFLSNEGLHEAAHADLLAALVGPGRRVLFDESHLGISEHPGIMTLARRYRLQGALATLGLLAALFVWRNAASLLPARTGTGPAGGGDDAPVTGRDAAAGFLNLLRRGVAPARLPAMCVAQWQQNLSPATGPSADARHPATPENVARVQETLVAAGKQSPAALYRTICARLRQRDTPGAREENSSREV